MPTGRGDGNDAALRCRRFASAAARLQHAGIAVTDDVEAGAAEYVRLRAGWDVTVVRLADFLGYTPQQIDARA